MHVGDSYIIVIKNMQRIYIPCRNSNTDWIDRLIVGQYDQIVTAFTLLWYLTYLGVSIIYCSPQ